MTTCLYSAHLPPLACHLFTSHLRVTFLGVGQRLGPLSALLVANLIDTYRPELTSLVLDRNPIKAEVSLPPATTRTALSTRPPPSKPTLLLLPLA